MMKSRVLEERLIKIHKKGKAFFWVGGPGEEGFGVPLGLLIHKGQGLSYDWLHLHYRANPTLVAMGMPMITPIRLIMNKKTDPCTGGRNFASHYSFPEWNVAPINSVIEVQYITAIGTAWRQKKQGGRGITVVTGGDAGTAEGDFTSSLLWSNRKNNELPMLITVQNNLWGISTSYEEQLGDSSLCDRAKAFKIKATSFSGHDPIECYIRLKEEIEWIRKTRKPVFVEAKVSRLYGHSSSSGAAFIEGERDGLREFESLLLKHDILKERESKDIKDMYEKEGRASEIQANSEDFPSPQSVWKHCYCQNETADWRKF